MKIVLILFTVSFVSLGILVLWQQSFHQVPQTLPSPTSPVLERESLIPQTKIAPLVTSSSYYIDSMSHMYQKMNNCGPASAAMAASTLSVDFDQFHAAATLKGGPNDKNVSAPEITAFLENEGLNAIYRLNGTPELIEALVASDIPVIVEQWLLKPANGELDGHYRVVRGYDRERKVFTTNDAFNGADFEISYAQFDSWWRPFLRGYIVVYKPEQTQTVQTILGQQWDAHTNKLLALDHFILETETIGDGYSYFNLGTTATQLEQYETAKTAYDRALTSTFPKYFLWYQFEPLRAYLELREYDRVLEMTDRLLRSAGEMEEARAYRGLVFMRQGRKSEARVEFEKALQANPRYALAQESLESL